MTVQEQAAAVVPFNPQSTIPAISPLEAMIERASRDPSIDLQRMEHLLDLLNRERDETRRRAYYASLAAAEAEMKTVLKNKTNSQTHSKYASYAAIDSAIRPVYTEHGFAISFNTTPSTIPDVVNVECEVTHKGGHTKLYGPFAMPADGKGAKGGDVMSKTHAAGAAITYAMRYLLKMIFNVTTGDEDEVDDDGNLAGNVKITPEQVAHINKLLEESGCPPAKLLEKMRVEAIEDIAITNVDIAISMLHKYKAAAEKKAAEVKVAA